MKDTDGVPVSLDLSGIPPRNHSYFTYEGSLITPDCDEVVKWLLLRSPISISGQQKTALTKIYPKTARPVQAYGDRQPLLKEE